MWRPLAVHKRWTPVLMFATVCIVVAAILARLYWPLGSWVRYPLSYTGDGLWNLFVIKTVLQTGWYASNSLLGAPYTAVFLDFAKPETLYLLLFHIGGWFTNNVALLHNLFYFLGFFLVASSGLAVLRDGFRLSWPLAGAGALLYTFLPFHFLRLRHLFLSNYFVAPLAVWLALQVASDRAPFFEAGRLGGGRWSVWFGATLLASTSIYYAFFGLCLIFGVGVLEAIRTRTWINLMSATLVCVLVGGLVLVNLSPSLLFSLKEGRNEELAVRTMGEVDLLALRPIQLLLPSDAHRLPLFARIAKKYEAAATFAFENKTSCMGLLGGLGFALLLVTLLAGFREKEVNTPFAVAVRINAIAVLLSVVGGAGAMLAFLITPVFRGLNRISVIIAFVSLAALLLTVDRCLSVAPDRWRRGARLLAAAVLTIFGLWDQLPANLRPDASAIAAVYENDRTFVHEIEMKLPPQAQIFQLPYVGFPESPPRFKEPAYSHLRGFLHSNTLRWSYGGMRGREADQWRRALAELPLAEQVAIAWKSGFKGLLLDRRATPDEGVELEQGLRELGLPAPQESTDKTLAFYHMAPPRGARPQLLVLPVLGRGFYALERDGEEKWAWSSGNANLSLINYERESQRIRLSFTLSSLSARSVRILSGEQCLAELTLPPGVREHVALELDVMPGQTAMRLVTDTPAVTPSNRDWRQLGMMLRNIRLAHATP